MILRASVVVTMDGPPIKDGVVIVEGNQIVDVRKFNPISDVFAEEVVDLGQHVLLPGLINAHCHLDYTGLRGQIAPEESFAEWVRAINAAKARLSPGNYLKSIAAGFVESRKFGTTSLVNFEAFPELVMRKAPPVRTWWMAELIDVRDPNMPEQLIGSAMSALSRPETKGLAPHAPFTASLDLFRLCQETARQHNLLLSTHLAESREEVSMFQDASGPLYELMKETGRDMRDCGGETPLAYLMRHVALDERWLIVHLNELAESDFDLLAESMPRFHIVHCPRSHRYFDHAPFQFERLREFGFNICLGTDSLASNTDLSLFAEMRAMRAEYPTLSFREVLEMVTINPARALDRPSQLGQIKPEFLADMIALPLDGGRDVFEEIVAFDKAVPWTMLDGEARSEV